MSERTPSALVQQEWQGWIDEVAARLEVSAADVDLVRTHALTHRVADVFSRPMAPVSAHLWALAGGTDEAASVLIDCATEFAARSDTPPRSPGVKDADRHLWRPFVEQACRRLSCDPAVVDEIAVLALTRQASQRGAKMMAPVVAQLWGAALAAGHPSQHVLATLEQALHEVTLPQQGH